jgi:spermidine synthase
VRLRYVTAVALGFCVWISIFPGLNNCSNARWYEALHGLPTGTITLFSAYSPYQKVDVLEDPNGSRYLYLDGLLHFGTNRWSRLNVIMGAVSADLVKPNSSLVVGAGSMELERFIAERSGHVTTVEIDPVVVQAGTQYLNEVNLMGQLTNRTIIIDDAKHFIANTDLRYDLVATDVPAAFSIQTAMLYSVPFYQQIAERLTPNGVLVVNLTATLTEDDRVARRIAQSLLTIFDELYMVTSGSSRLSYVFAGSELPFDAVDLQQALENNGEIEYTIYHRAAVENIVGDAPPITLDSMDIVLQISADWIAQRLTKQQE